MLYILADKFEDQFEGAVCPLADAIMYVMAEVFNINSSLLICKPNESEGRFLLEEILIGGNFGKYDKRNMPVPVFLVIFVEYCRK